MSGAKITNCKTELKIVVVGNSGTGKTSFCTRWIKDNFNEVYKATIMSEFSYKIYEYKGNYYKIQFWDIAGQDKNIHASKIFTKDAHGVIILADITNPETLESTLKWKKAIDDNSKFLDTEENLPCILVQNKVDLVSEEELGNEDEVRTFAQENNFVNFFRTSAKIGTNVDECMDFLIKTIIEKFEEYTRRTNKAPERDRSSIVQLAPKPNTNSMLTKKGWCC